jgi:hypothetical protein
MSMDMDTDRGWAILKQLTWSRVLIGIAAGLASLSLLYVYQHLDTAIPSLMGNTLAMFGLVLAIALAVIGGVGTRLYLRLQHKLDGAQDEMREFLREQLKRVEQQQRDCTEREIHTLKRLAMMNSRQNLIERTLNDAGIPTDFGDIQDEGKHVG